MKQLSSAFCARFAVRGLAFAAAAILGLSACAANETYAWVASGDGIGASTYVKIFDDVGTFSGRLRLVGFSTADGEYTVTSNRTHVTGSGAASGEMPAGAYTHQMSSGALFDGTTTKSIRVQLAQPDGSTALYARITAVTTATGDYTAVPDLRYAVTDAETVDGTSYTDAATLLANAVTKIVVSEIGDGTDVYTYTASEKPETLGYGAVRLTYDGDYVKTVTATPLIGRKIVIEGDTMAFAASATNYLQSSGELVYSNAVTGAGGIYVTRPGAAGEFYLDYSGSNLDTDYTTLFPGRKLEEWMPYSAGNKNGKGWWGVDSNKVYNIRYETDGTMTAQRQGYITVSTANDAVAVTKFQLKQVGDDIAGRVVYGGYWLSANASIGSDSDAIIANPETYGKFVNQGVSTPSCGDGYGMNKTTIYRVDGLPTLRFAGGLTSEGRLIVLGFTHVVLERAKTGAVKGCYSRLTNARLTFRDPE